MKLTKIKREDLIYDKTFGSHKIDSFITLHDSHWTHHSLTARFKTKQFGSLYVKFLYYGSNWAKMEVEQFLNGKTEKIMCDYSADIYQRHIVKFLAKHIGSIISCNEGYTFNGEEDVIEFFNDVVEHKRATIKLEEHTKHAYFL